ncbi:hypothetical protein ACK8P5_10750 [Paenibacillus sp. EC2-1]|uniref:hypothetical protein n=1 Tax=Paenibacillus sp. EC2-1 TaxID=3388665 RepID=UPI003BEEEC7F
MNIERIYKFTGTKEVLMKHLLMVDSSAQVNYKLHNEVLEVIIQSFSKDELRVEFENFNMNYKRYSTSFFISESFYIVICNFKTLYAGEKFIKPLLKYLDTILALMLFIPQDTYNKIDPKLIDLITQDYYSEGSVQYDEVVYQAFQSAECNI